MNNFGHDAHFDIMLTSAMVDGDTPWDNPVVTYQEVPCPGQAQTHRKTCECNCEHGAVNVPTKSPTPVDGTSQVPPKQEPVQQPPPPKQEPPQEKPPKQTPSEQPAPNPEHRPEKPHKKTHHHKKPHTVKPPKMRKEKKPHSPGKADSEDGNLKVHNMALAATAHLHTMAAPELHADEEGLDCVCELIEE